MLPVLGREVVEGQQRVAIFDQALDRLVVFDAPGLDEDVERCERIVLGLGHPDLLKRSLGFRVLSLRQLVQDIGGLVYPAALAAGLRPHLLDRLPEAERTVGDCELGAVASPRRFRSRSNSLQDWDAFRTRADTIAHARAAHRDRT